MASRVPPIPFKQWPPEMGEALKAMAPPKPRFPLSGEKRPTGANILGTLAHNPALARAWFTLNGHLLRATSLDERQRELVMLRVAAMRNSIYQWAQHLSMGRDAGLSDLEIAAVAWGSRSQFWSESEAALLRAVEELLDSGAIGELTWSTLSADLTTAQILDLIVTVGAYSTTASIIETLNVELDDDLREHALSLIRPNEDVS